MNYRDQYLIRALFLMMALCGFTACENKTSTPASVQAEVELYLVDTSRKGLSDEEMDGFVDSVESRASQALQFGEFVEALNDSPNWPIKETGATLAYLSMNARVTAMGDALRDTLTIRVVAPRENEALEIANTLAAYLVEGMVDLRARKLESNHQELMLAQVAAKEDEVKCLLALNKRAEELGYSAEDLLEPDVVEKHPSVLNYRVELETLKELKVQLKLKEVRGENIEDIQRAIERQDKVVKEAVVKLADADVRSALTDSELQKVENVMNLAIGSLRNLKNEREALVEVSKRLQVMEKLLPLEGVAISPMLVQRHGAELVK